MHNRLVVHLPTSRLPFELPPFPTSKYIFVGIAKVVSEGVQVLIFGLKSFCNYFFLFQNLTSTPSWLTNDDESKDATVSKAKHQVSKIECNFAKVKLMSSNATWIVDNKWCKLYFLHEEIQASVPFFYAHSEPTSTTIGVRVF